MIVDAHHHFWNPARIPQTWMTDEHGAIDRPFEPGDLEPLLAACGVQATVVVQSAAEDRDTDYLFELLADAPWVGAVTAWCRLDDADLARRRLDELAVHPKLRAIRHLIHMESDPHWLLRDEVQPALALLEERGLLLELPAVFPDHLDDVPELARRHPALTLVVDHLGKPPIGRASCPSGGNSSRGPRSTTTFSPRSRASARSSREPIGPPPTSSPSCRPRLLRSAPSVFSSEATGRSPC